MQLKQNPRLSPISSQLQIGGIQWHRGRGEEQHICPSGAPAASCVHLSG